VNTSDSARGLSIELKHIHAECSIGIERHGSRGINSLGDINFTARGVGRWPLHITASTSTGYTESWSNESVGVYSRQGRQGEERSNKDFGEHFQGAMNGVTANEELVKE
jgi:hypothetical protein